MYLETVGKNTKKHNYVKKDFSEVWQVGSNGLVLGTRLILTGSTLVPGSRLILTSSVSYTSPGYWTYLNWFSLLNQSWVVYFISLVQSTILVLGRRLILTVSVSYTIVPGRRLNVLVQSSPGQQTYFHWFSLLHQSWVVDLLSLVQSPSLVRGRILNSTGSVSYTSPGTWSS